MSPHWFAMSAAGGVLVAAVLSRAAASDEPLRLMVVDPGHFHAALLQKDMLPGVSDTVHIYAPLGPDLNAHLARIAGFNSRADHPTHWLSRIYAGPDYLDRLIAERPGNVAILSGRNDAKIDAVLRLLGAGIHVLADKPWIIEPENLPKLEAALRLADQRHLAAYDMMTQRYEIANLVQRALVNDPAVFGSRIEGTAQEPAVTMESLHCLLKLVAGRPNLRPAWFFDVKQQGEGLTDVGTHLVDLVPWVLFPDQPIDYRKDIHVLSGERRPTVLTLEQFQKVTGVAAFPPYLESAVHDGRLDYFCNNTVDYTIRGVRVRLVIRWDFEATAGPGDSETAAFRGSESRIDIRQGAEEHYRPELYVVPNRPDRRAVIRAAVEHRLQQIASAWPGLEVRDAAAGALQIAIPDRLRIGHESHFALVGEQFRKYVADPSSMPAWEAPNMLAKYYVTTRGVELARAGK